MATNYVQPGTSYLYANAGSAISSGAVVINDGHINVALEDIAATTGTGMVACEGVFRLPKVSAAVIKAGEMVIWDVTAGAFDDNAATPATGDVSNQAMAMEAAGAGVTSLKVKINVSKGTVA